MFNFFFKIFTITFFLTLSSESKDFNDILINGNERISNETIIVFSEVTNLQNVDENSINLILKKLYNTGYFKDVTVKFENDNLIINVVENPVIQTIFIEGIKRKKTEESIIEALTLKSRSSFNTFLVKQDELTILKFLKDKGFYFSTINTTSKDLGNNKVDLFYKIVLGNKAKISKISFIGDKKFKDSTLRSIIISEEFKFWKFLSGKKFLNENIINFDKRLLYNFYKNKGFYDVNIDSSFANYLGNNEFEIIHNIASGEKFYFNELSLNLPLDYEEVNFKKLKAILDELKGKSYSLNAIDKILNEIDKIALNEQFEFLKSSVDEKVNGNLINLVFNIEESEKFYIGRVNIFGNNVTREDVIRNNLIVDEGDAFNELLHKKSINKIKSLNFFEKVEYEILDGSSQNQKNINITVSEKPTGEISAGAGVGTNGGTVSFGIKENNFLGRGIEFATNLSISTESLKGFIALDNPNYNGSDRSLNLTVESSITDRLKDFGYKSNKTGFSIGSGFEFYDDLYLITGISSYVEKLDTDSSATASMQKQDGSYFDTFFNYTLNYDKRNQTYKPTDGFVSRFTQNIPLVSDSYTLTNSYSYKLYNEWLNENIASFSFYAKATNSLANKKVKLSDRLFLPSKRLRGFETGKIGPKDGLDYIGGNYAIAVNLATTLPQILPSFQNTDFSLFFDAGNIWGVDYSGNTSDNSRVRSSVGLAVNFFTPIGPLNFSLTEPITKGKNDITESFRFNLGTTF